jgi:hypothetical protein
MVNDEKIWKLFLRKHWREVCFFIVLAIIALIGAIYVFLWFVEEAQATGLVPVTLNLWTMNHVVFFILYLLLWEIIYIGIPVIIAAVAIYLLWWKKIPFEERKECRDKHLFGSHSKKADGGGAISIFINILFIIKVYLDGNWNEPFANWTFSYLVNTGLWALFVALIIIGIPMVLGGLWWLSREMKKDP